MRNAKKKYDHDTIAKRLAKKLKAKYRSEGIDILSKGRGMEVATTETDIYQSITQLKRSRVPKKYLVVPPPFIVKAKQLLKGSGIGIMNHRGQIRKRSRRKRSS